jgi:hypothetical protein
MHRPTEGGADSSAGFVNPCTGGRSPAPHLGIAPPPPRSSWCGTAYVLWRQRRESVRTDIKRWSAQGRAVTLRVDLAASAWDDSPIRVATGRPWNSVPPGRGGIPRSTTRCRVCLNWAAGGRREPLPTVKYRVFVASDVVLAGFASVAPAPCRRPSVHRKSGPLPRSSPAPSASAQRKFQLHQSLGGAECRSGGRTEVRPPDVDVSGWLRPPD